MIPKCSGPIQRARRAYVERLVTNDSPAKQREAVASADVNIALVKYWGKRNTTLNLPVTSSLSVGLPGKGTWTSVALDEGLDRDEVTLNGALVSESSPVYQRTVDHVDLLRQPGDRFRIESYNSIPTAAGLASSASGFAALTEAMVRVYDLQLSREATSIIARLGSGSACRSVFTGFVRWDAGEREDGLDSYAVKLDASWPQLCIGLVMVESTPKPIGSTDGMLLTQKTALQYQVWPEQVCRDMVLLEGAIDDLDFTVLGSVSESNALCMHASMLCSRPPLLYWQPESVEHMHRVWSMRKQGIEVYFTMDAGPNLKLLFMSEDEEIVKSYFSELEVVKPFLVKD